jgi:HEAT repeat protein
MGRCRILLFVLTVYCFFTLSSRGDDENLLQTEKLEQVIARLEQENLDLRRKAEEIFKQLVDQQKTFMDFHERQRAPDRLFQAAFAEPDPVIRRWAIRQLGEMGDDAVIHFGRFSDLKGDESELVRAAANAAWEKLQQTSLEALRREFERLQNLRKPPPSK